MADNTQAIKDSLNQSLLNVTLALQDMSASPRPTYSLDGRSYSWNELFESLMRKQNELRVAIQEADGPFEERSYGLGGW